MYIEDATDLMPSSAVAKGLSALAAAILMVEPELVAGLAIVVMLNGVASLWYTFYNDESALLVLYWFVVRIVVYCITMPGIVVLSHITSVDIFRRLAFGAAAGWEVAVTLGLAARISPSFEPIYTRIMDLVDKHTPMEATVKDVDNEIDSDD